MELVAAAAQIARRRNLPRYESHWVATTQALLRIKDLAKLGSRALYLERKEDFEILLSEHHSKSLFFCTGSESRAYKRTTTSEILVRGEEEKYFLVAQSGI